MKYDIAFLSRIIPAEIDEEVRNNMIGLMEDAAITWQNHIIEGIEYNNGGRVRLFNYLPVNSYPNTYKKPFIKKIKFSHAAGSKDINLGYCNIKYIKRFVQWIPLFNELDHWAKQNTKYPKVLIAYTMYPEFMMAIKHIKKKYPEIVTINIVVDMPQYTVLRTYKKSFLNSIYTGWSDKQAYDNIQYVDGFITITKQMAEILSPNKPYKVVEGICTGNFPERNRENDGLVKILYAGMLHQKFGIIKLLDAFEKIQDNSFRLLVCGIGEAEDEIKIRSERDSRIKFFGKLKQKDVLQLISDSDIIVNPRENVGEFTKYSFPSKNMEALSSGVPFVGYKLDGIPDDYDCYINYPEDNSIEALADKLLEVGKSERCEAEEKAKKAQIWVRSNKECSAQGVKILQLINDIQNKRRKCE